MGVGIAQVAAQAGLDVTLLDRSAEALATGQRRLAASLAGGIERGKLTAEEAEDAGARIAWDTGRGGLSEADCIIEAVFEDLAVKREVLRGVSAQARPDAVLATNTSTFRIGDLAQHCERPERFLGLHFFNPVPAMKLVEVIPHAHTSPTATEGALALCERLGKTALIAPDIPGFIVNRVFAALVAAAADLWAAGADPAAIDEAVELGLAHKLGPLGSADLVGLDVMLAILRSLHAQTGDPRFSVPEGFAELVAAGKLGRKSGEGFHRYGETR
jgi:3-hydroxybutyryl-CoA dehydrogenase